MFLDVRGGDLEIKNNFEEFQIPLHWALLVAPAWTLALELMFYLIAPYVLKTPLRLGLAFLFSVGVRISLYSLGAPTDPWLYRLFPAVLVFFLVGAISHQAFFRFTKNHQPSHTGRAIHGIASFVGALLIVGFASNFLTTNPYASETMAVAMALCLPGIFVFQNIFQWDRKIGEYSYPLYIWHLLIFQIVNTITGYIFTPTTLFAATVIFGLAASNFSNRFIDSRFKTFRNSNKRLIRTQQ